MAIGTAAAIGLGVAGVGSFLGSQSASKAAGKAADAQTQVAAENTALQRDIYGQNKELLSPYVQAGIPATQSINALLGLGGGTAGGADWGAYLQQNPDVAREYYDDNDERTTFATPEAYAEWHYKNYGQNEGRAFPTVNAASSQDAAQQAFDTFRNSTGYQFRLNEGQNAVRGGFSGSGTLQSGAALKALQEHGQGLASAEFGNYLNALGNQQAVGMGAASATAGVGQNFANSLGQINQTKGDALSNAALAKGQNNPFANSLSLLGGGIYGAR